MTKTILVVDDQPEVRELITVTLEVEPYEILTAKNGHQALEIARTQHPDLIFLDVMMPDGPDGRIVCRQLKANPNTQDIPIVMLTAQGQDADQEAGYAAGADDYFIKPFSPLELIEKVEHTLG